ncbi:hypothetical protein SEA_TWONLO_67 [Gordonia phage Twonlo]|nr:hypothetical protein SEA_TWONLO_67 [Gordonia phage Twonlo]
MSSHYDADGVQFRFDMPVTGGRRALIAEIEVDDDPILTLYTLGTTGRRHSAAHLTVAETAWLAETLPLIQAALDVYAHRTHPTS